MAGLIELYCFYKYKILTHKYIDDITVTESITESDKGHLQEAVNTIKEWSENNNIRLNEKKLKKC